MYSISLDTELFMNSIYTPINRYAQQGAAPDRHSAALHMIVTEYNELRPHEAIGMKTPESIHETSDRNYPETIVEWEYPKDVIEKYVSRNGAVRTGRNDWLFLTTALAGKYVGFEEIGNRIYRIFFRDFFLGYADMKDRKVYDIMTDKDELKL